MSDLSRVKPGLRIEVSGPTGCGKTAVVDLIQLALLREGKVFKHNISKANCETIEVVEGEGVLPNPKPTCATCRFGEVTPKGEPGCNWVLCRYNPPNAHNNWSNVRKNDWCGKYERKDV